MSRSNQELMYEECECDLNMACRLYANRYPYSQQPNCRTDQNAVQRLRKTGRVNPSYEKVVDKKDRTCFK